MDYLDKVRNLGKSLDSSLSSIKLDFSEQTINLIFFISVAVYIPVAYTFKPSADLAAENNYRRTHAAFVQLASYFFGISLALWCIKNFENGSAGASWAAILIGATLLSISAFSNKLKQKPVDGFVQRVAYSTDNVNIAMIGLLLAGLTRLYKLNNS
jgi:hypothetical protein